MPRLPTHLAPARATRRTLLFAALGASLIGVGLAACSDKNTPAPVPPPRTPGPLRIVATIPPVRGIIDPLLTAAGAKYQLHTLLPPGASEHGFEITPASMEAIGNADLVVMIGLGMEPQVEKFLAQHTSASRRVLTLSDGVMSAMITPAATHNDHANHDATDHDHADADHDHDDHHHDHSTDPHIWLDPVLVSSMVSECASAFKPLAAIASVDAAKLDEAQRSTTKRVNQVHADYQAALAHSPRRTIVVAHDAYGYLARRYNLQVIAITGLSAGEPQPMDVKKAAAAVMENKLTTIFIEPQLSPAAAMRLATATGAKTAVLDPLGDGDWFALMANNLTALKSALGSPTSPPASPPAATPQPAPTTDSKH